MKKHSLEAKNLLSKAEMYEIKAGGNGTKNMTGGSCSICTTCVGCTTSCTACTSTAMDVIVL